MRIELIREAISIAIEGGLKILDVKKNCSINVELKEDESPVTQADKAASLLIVEELRKRTSISDIVSEEEEFPDYDAVRSKWECFWMVDPLDGTKEFINGRKEYTVNIALIENRVSTLGVIYVPELDELYFGDINGNGVNGSFRVSEASSLSIDQIISESKKMPTSKLSGVYKVVFTNSHMNSKTEAYLKQLDLDHKDDGVELIAVGSSLKMCLVADGKADLFPRLGNVMEWDTAAGEAICLAAGCTVSEFDGTPIVYNKPSFLQPWIVVERKRE